jgi:Sec-independent protein translocase protein TatA
MDLFGIGPLELIWVLLVATIVLGPAKMVDLARNLGKFWREAQRLLRETADAATVGLNAPIPAENSGKQSEAPPQAEGSVKSGNGLAEPSSEESDTPPPQEGTHRRG